MEGEQDTDRNDHFDGYLPSYRVPPVKLTFFMENDTLPGWTNRIQLTYSAKRDRFGGESMNFGEGEVKSFVIVSVSSSIRLGPGTVRVAVENVLNERYFPILSQSANVGRLYTAGEGTVLRVSYVVQW
jgi:iron complex outermembrane receptor protein